MAQVNVQETIAKYESFMNDVIKEDLKWLQLRLHQINAEIFDLVQQKHTLKVITNKEMHPDGFKTQINLGCNFFMEAAVPDTSSLLMNIGLNHYLEFNLTEAEKYLDIRIKAFERKAEELKQKAAESKAHIKVLLLGIAELQNKADHDNKKGGNIRHFSQ